MIRPKYRYFEEHKNEYDVLFLGSSRFFHQIIPSRFDAAVTASTGRELRSFNMGCDALWPPESHYFLRKILALHPGKLRWVVIELMDIDPRINDREKSSRREAYWHDWAHTRLAWSALDQWRQIKAQAKKRLAWAHARLLLEQWVNMGRGAEIIENLTASRKERSDRTEEWVAGQGYRAGPAHGIPATEMPEYTSAVKALMTHLDPVKLNPILEEATKRLIAEITASGAEPIFVIAPTLNPRENFKDLPDGATLMAFNNPGQFPALYDPANHYDGWHLNEKGAIELTGLLARDFAAHLNLKSKSKPGESE